MDYKYYCDKCKYGTNSKFSFERHQKSKSHEVGKVLEKKIIKNPAPKKGRKKLKCELCDYETIKSLNLLIHKLNNHGTKEEKQSKYKYYCDICDYGTFIEQNYEKHNKSKKHNNFVEYQKKLDKK